MPYPDWLAYSIEEQDFLHNIYGVGKSLSVFLPSNSLCKYITSWGWNSLNYQLDCICLLKHLEGVFHSGIPYTIIGIGSDGMYYGENFFEYVRLHGVNSVDTFSNLWVVWCERYIVPVFVLRSVTATDVKDLWIRYM